MDAQRDLHEIQMLQQQELLGARAAAAAATRAPVPAMADALQPAILRTEDSLTGTMVAPQISPQPSPREVGLTDRPWKDSDDRAPQPEMTHRGSPSLEMEVPLGAAPDPDGGLVTASQFIMPDGRTVAGAATRAVPRAPLPRPQADSLDGLVASH